RRPRTPLLRARSRMVTLLGLVIVFAGILGGYMWAGGPLHVLVQPAQLAIIGGAAVGTLVMAAPGKMRGRLFAAIGKAFRSSAPTRDDYLDLLRLQYEVFSFMRKHGAVLLDDHLRDVHQSTIFRKYPSFLRRPVAVEFFRDALQQIVNGTASADELDVLLATEIETQHEEAGIPVALIQRALPPLHQGGRGRLAARHAPHGGGRVRPPRDLHRRAANGGRDRRRLPCRQKRARVTTFKRRPLRPHHYGAAWKVAYADFTTAMMALFVVLWLLTQADVRLRQQIAQYFRQPGVLPGGAVISPYANELYSRTPKVVTRELLVAQGQGEQELLENEKKAIDQA